MPRITASWASPLLEIGRRLRVLLRRAAFSRRAGLVAVLLVITWFTGSRLLNEGLHAHIYDFGNEALRAVQAWENHGFFSMGGMYPWGRG